LLLFSVKGQGYRHELVDQFKVVIDDHAQKDNKNGLKPSVVRPFSERERNKQEQCIDPIGGIEYGVIAI
jgi:hypothetical protein